MNRIGVLGVFICIMVAISVGVIVLYPVSDTGSCYVGVTYCGDSVEEAKQLIDKVKSYSNLFVLQSGSLQYSPEDMNEICDYAFSCDMYFIVYFGSSRWMYLDDWLETCEGRWEDNLLGVYYGDELGGKMLDDQLYFWDDDTGSSITKNADGSVYSYSLSKNELIQYCSDGKIVLTLSDDPIPQGGDGTSSFEVNQTVITYYPNSTIAVELRDYDNPPQKVENFELPYTYDELWGSRFFKTYEETSERFVNTCSDMLTRGPKSGTVVPAYTSDYALYWYGYKAGYDVILAQFGWNHTIEQDVALVRGAANLQNKSWGAIITWKYEHPPYLDTGEAIFEQMETAYKAGAEYIAIFNFAENMTDYYGTLQEEHFHALERFWNEVMQNPRVKRGTTTATAVLVLPENYGWGMRYPDDRIWGLWGPDEKSLQIWELSQHLFEQYGLNLDIIYQDPEFPFEDKYQQIYYWNQPV